MPGQVVVINVGTNDFYNSTVPPTLTRAGYVAAYARLVRAVMDDTGPATRFFLCVGPMHLEPARSAARSWTQEVPIFLDFLTQQTRRTVGRGAPTRRATRRARETGGLRARDLR
jgi:hypothetical protein